jgi:hypothetical protein
VLLVQTTEQVFNAVQCAKQRATAFCTNFFPVPARLEAWIGRRELQLCVGEGAALFLRKDRDFWRLYFSAGNFAALQARLRELAALRQDPVVIDLIGQEAPLRELGEVVSAAGFRPYSRLVRLARPSQPLAETAREGGPGRPEFAVREDAAAVLALLEESFDRYADQLPALYEIEMALANKQILAVKHEGRLAALVHFETQGFTSTVRFWVVGGAFKAHGFGSSVIREYFNQHPGVRRFVLWVAAANTVAVDRYRHYGYTPDGLVDQVMVNPLIPQ